MIEFKTPFTIRGDNLVCPLALNLDLYKNCDFSCRFCFILELESIWGLEWGKPIPLTNLKEVEDTLKRGTKSKDMTKNQIVNALRKNFPIRFGNKTDNFQHIEKEKRLSLKFLKLFKDINYVGGLVLETKSNLLLESEYFSTITDIPNVKITESLMPNDKIAEKFEPLVPSQEKRLEVIKKFSEVGIECGVKLDPIMATINDSEKELKEIGERIKNSGAKYLTFYNYRTSREKLAKINFAKLGFNWIKMTNFNYNDDWWRPKGLFCFKIFKELGLRTSCADFVTFPFDSDCENCCSLEFPSFNQFTFQHALHLINEKGKVTWREMEEKYVVGNKEKMKKLWNRADKRFWSLWDIPQVKGIERDGEGNIIWEINENFKLSKQEKIDSYVN